MFVTIEGVEGAGKSTQIQMLLQRLVRLGVPALVSKEPGGTPLGQELRSLLLAPHLSGEKWCPESELLLFYADRAQHIASVIRPALESGRLILVDRFDDSTRAYQGAQGISEATMDKLGEVVLGRLRPHLTLILDMDPALSLERVRARNAAAGNAFKETRFDNETLDFHTRVRKRFLAIAQRDPQRVTLVPADRTPEEVHEAIWAHLSPLLRSSGHPVE
ncbi:dTMP kinase [Holophaga foetida]|uniref:dTMP kinase n=1 Tax=Holophaga foetida TaxID=35839 RepID=UPI0005BC962D|nr:dTMP kinase [Holophaga foetida]